MDTGNMQTHRNRQPRCLSEISSFPTVPTVHFVHVNLSFASHCLSVFVILTVIGINFLVFLPRVSIDSTGRDRQRFVEILVPLAAS